MYANIESPHWLALKNKHDDALKMLFRLRLSGADVHGGTISMNCCIYQPELTKIERSIAFDPQPLFSLIGADVLIISSLLMVFKQVL